MAIYTLPIVLLVAVLNHHHHTSALERCTEPNADPACQDGNMMLKCKKHKKLVIKDTFYGRNDDATCANKKLDADKTCDEATPAKLKRKIHSMCSGKSKCRVPATTKFVKKYGSRCPSAHKYLVVTYACKPHKKSNLFSYSKQARLAQPGGGSAYNFASPDYVEPMTARLSCNSIMAGTNFKMPGYHSQG